MPILVQILQWTALLWLALLVLRLVAEMRGPYRAYRQGRLRRAQWLGLLTARVAGLGAVLLVAFGAYYLVGLPLRRWQLWQGAAALLATVLLGFSLASALSWLYHRFLDPQVQRFFTAGPRDDRDQPW